MKTPQWTVKITREYNPDRTVVAYGESVQAVVVRVASSLRDTYGITALGRSKFFVKLKV